MLRTHALQQKKERKKEKRGVTAHHAGWRVQVLDANRSGSCNINVGPLNQLLSSLFSSFLDPPSKDNVLVGCVLNSSWPLLFTIRFLRNVQRYFFFGSVLNASVNERESEVQKKKEEEGRTETEEDISLSMQRSKLLLESNQIASQLVHHFQAGHRSNSSRS